MDIELNQAHKRLVLELWRALDEAPPEAAAALMGRCMAADLHWYGPDPWLELRGVPALAAGCWQPLRHAFEGLRRHTWILLGGPSNGRRDGNIALDGRYWVGGTGVFGGIFRHDLLGIPAHGRPATLRWGEFHRFEHGRIVETYCLLDFIDLMEQAGVPVLPPCRGAPGLYPPPQAVDGVLQQAQSALMSRTVADRVPRP